MWIHAVAKLNRFVHPREAGWLSRHARWLSELDMWVLFEDPGLGIDAFETVLGRSWIQNAHILPQEQLAETVSRALHEIQESSEDGRGDEASSDRNP